MLKAISYCTSSLPEKKKNYVCIFCFANLFLQIVFPLGPQDIII